MTIDQSVRHGVTGKEPTAEERAAAATMLRMIWGIHISRAVYVAAELGIADRLASGPMSSAELAGQRAHEPSLYRVLRRWRRLMCSPSTIAGRSA